MILHDVKLNFHYPYPEKSVDVIVEELEFYDDTFSFNTRGVTKAVEKVLSNSEDSSVNISSDELVKNGVSSITLTQVVPSVASRLEYSVKKSSPQFVHFTVLNSSNSLFCYRKKADV